MLSCAIVLTHCGLVTPYGDRSGTVHDAVIKWKHFPRYWPFVRGIHREPVNSPHKGPVTRSFDVFFDLRQNKRLSKQWWDWWFETPPSPLWRHCNDLAQIKACAWCHQTLTWTSIWLVGSGGIHMRAILNRVATLYNEFVNHTFKIIAISLRGQ